MAERELSEKTNGFKTGLEKTCLFIITWGSYAAMFIPLIVMTRFFFPFVAPKTTIFRMIIEVIFAAYLFLVSIDRKRYLPKINALNLSLAIFVGVFVLASFFGVNLERSFWSTYERMTGIWTMLHLFAFYIVLSSVFKQKRDWEKILGFSILAGTILSLYVILGNQLSTRGGGTIGNTSFMAAYLLFDIFFALMLFLANFLKKDGWSVFWQVFSVLSLAAMLPVLFASSARAATASFFVGIFLMGLGYLLSSGKKALKSAGLAIIAVIFVSAVLGLIFQPSFLKQEVKSTLYEMQSRFGVWETGFKAWQDRPILGWGPENFNVPFQTHFNPCMFTSCGGEIWFDRVHNIVLDNLVTMGVVGLLSYLVIFAVVIIGLLKIIPKIIDKRNVFIPLGMVVILLSYFFQNLFVFDMINTYLMFFLSLAFCSFLVFPRQEENGAKKKVNPLFSALILAVTVFLLWQGNIAPLAAGNQIIAFVSAKNFDEMVNHFKGSLDSWMNKYEAREQFMQQMNNIVYQSIPESKKQDVVSALDLAAGEMEKSVQENILDFRPRLFLGGLYTAFFRFTGDTGKLALAQQTIQKAIELSPTNMQGYWQMAEVMLAQQKNKEAAALIQKSIDLEPKYANSHWYLATIYKIDGNLDGARAEIIKANNLGLHWNEATLKSAAEVYEAFKDDQGLISFYLKALESYPDNATVWAGLAAAYANVGQFEKAREASQRVIEIDPSLQPKVEEFLKALSQ